jgi:hypothetical protein
LAFGIPTSREDFLKDKDSKDKDFANTIPGSWSQYEAIIMPVLKKVELVFKELGVTVIHNLTLDAFGNLFKESTAKIIILFAHWQEDAKSKVEFYDGLKCLDDIIAQIPINFHNLLDLNICRSKGLADALKKFRPNCYYRCKADIFENRKGEAVKLDFMLRFYMVFFKHLNRSETTYFNAYREVAHSFFKLLKQEGGNFDAIKGDL